MIVINIITSSKAIKNIKKINSSFCVGIEYPAHVAIKFSRYFNGKQVSGRVVNQKT